ncbi:MAG: uridine kinase [Bacilli bacterium]|nr:uridine kinase [Bacilli bacterium]
MNVTIIGIAGGTASGKTTVAKKVFEESTKYGTVTMVRVDDYYKRLDHLEFPERQKVNYDHPDAFDVDLLIQQLKDLKEGKEVDKPIYDFTVHNRSKTVEHLVPGNVVIVEGIMTFAIPELREMLDIKIFVDTPDDIRFIRRLERDINERARTVDSVIAQYLKTVRPMHHTFVEPSKKYADIIIPVGGENTVAIDFLITKIVDLLKAI